jgi:hypothetical protein
MKKLVFLLLLSVIFLTSCAESKTIDGKVYKPYGIANQDAVKDPSIVYELSPGSVICSIIFCETLVVPVYTVGWDLYEPVRKK